MESTKIWITKFGETLESKAVSLALNKTKFQTASFLPRNESVLIETEHFGHGSIWNADHPPLAVWPLVWVHATGSLLAGRPILEWSQFGISV